MTKPMTMTAQTLTEIISEINDEMTAVTPATIDSVATMVQDSIHEDCTWQDTDAPVTYAQILTAVMQWIDANAQPAQEDVFPVRIRTSADLDSIKAWYTIGRDMAQMSIDATGVITPFINEQIALYLAKSDDQSLALGLGMKDVVNGNPPPQWMEA